MKRNQASAYNIQLWVSCVFAYHTRIWALHSVQRFPLAWRVGRGEGAICAMYYISGNMYKDQGQGQTLSFNNSGTEHAFSLKSINHAVSTVEKSGRALFGITNTVSCM